MLKKRKTKKQLKKNLLLKNKISIFPYFNNISQYMIMSNYHIFCAFLRCCMFPYSYKMYFIIGRELVKYSQKYIILVKFWVVKFYFYNCSIIISYIKYAFTPYNIFYHYFLSESSYIIYQTIFYLFQKNIERYLTTIRLHYYKSISYLASQELYIPLDIVFKKIHQIGFITEWKVNVPSLKGSQNFLFQFIRSHLLLQRDTVSSMRILLIIPLDTQYHPEIYTLSGIKPHISHIKRLQFHMEDNINKAYNMFKKIYANDYYSKSDENYIYIELLTKKEFMWDVLTIPVPVMIKDADSINEDTQFYIT